MLNRSSQYAVVKTEIQHEDRTFILQMLSDLIHKAGDIAEQRGERVRIEAQPKQIGSKLVFMEVQLVDTRSSSDKEDSAKYWLFAAGKFFHLNREWPMFRIQSAGLKNPSEDDPTVNYLVNQPATLLLFLKGYRDGFFDSCK